MSKNCRRGFGTIAAAFYPKPVIVRLSNFKTNEYASLLGGAGFEPKEANPMLGFRGAARYAHPAYAAGFALECAALAPVRNQMGLTNLRIMVPFCRRAAEAERVIAAMAEHAKAPTATIAMSGICSEAPANYPEIARFLARLGIDSISVNGASLLHTMEVVHEAEAEAGQTPAAAE